MTITAGPSPARNTGRLTPSCVNVDSWNPGSEPSDMALHTSDGLTSSSDRAAGSGNHGSTRAAASKGATPPTAMAGPQPPRAGSRVVGPQSPAAGPATAHTGQPAVRRAPTPG